MIIDFKNKFNNSKNVIAIFISTHQKSLSKKERLKFI